MTSNKYNCNSSMVSHVWQPIPHIPAQGKIDFVAAHPTNSRLLFIGTSGNLYASFDQGKHWKRSMGLGTDAKINRLYFEQERIFLLTSKGLFESKNEGKSWKKIFRGRGQNENDVLSLSRDPQDLKKLYLGTGGGLFLSQDNGRTFQKETNELSRQLIQDMKVDSENNELFIASEKGLYRIVSHRNRWDRVYITHSPEKPEMEFEVGDDPDLEISRERDQINALIVTDHPSSIVAIGTKTGVWVSEDEGSRWERLPLSGLLNTQILDLIHSTKTNSFFAATEKGVYSYDLAGKRWKELNEGLRLTRVHKLALVSEDREMLYAATDEGVYQIMITPEIERPQFIQPISEHRWKLLTQLIQAEPTVGMIQKQAVRYANVNNWKTRRWQWASRFRALIPSLSVGKSFSKADTLDLDRGGTNDPDRYIIGPPDTSRNWNFDLNWNLSDFIWNTAQTSIDSREKLMVELRDDILSEATRLYFERRRTQVEFILQPPDNPLDWIQHLLRIEELTANLDALTGGFFTKELNNLYFQHPELQELWNLPGG